MENQQEKTDEREKAGACGDGTSKGETRREQLKREESGTMQWHRRLLGIVWK